MVSIKWLKFPCLIIFNKLHFPQNIFYFAIPYLQSNSIILRIFSPCCLSFSFPLPLLFPFLFFPHFPFVPFVFYFPFFPCFSQFASFPQFGLPFPKSAAPVLPHFLLPWIHMSMFYNCHTAQERTLGLIEMFTKGWVNMHCKDFGVQFTTPSVQCCWRTTPSCC